ncbi:MAG: alpha/beta hydrolase [bacterium]|nr:alpha/beta hydrolase [Gammaproteobacteria bacterium]
MYSEVNNRKTFYSTGTGHLKEGQPNVIFLHGAGMDHSVWVLPARYFARHGYNVYALDFPGHGRSEGLPLTSIDAMADWVSDAMDALGVVSSAIVGHSMGSLIALNFAARHADKTRVLALLGTSTPMPVTDLLLDAARNNHHDAIDMANTWSHSSFGQMGGNENPGVCMTMSGQRLLEQANPDVFYAGLNACNEFTNGAELAAEITAETMVIIGKQDKMTAAVSAQEVADSIPHCHTVLLHPCGHSMLSEQPNAVLDALAKIV